MERSTVALYSGEMSKVDEATLSRLYARRMGVTNTKKFADMHDVYRRTADVYRRSIAALGRSPRLKVSTASASALVVGDDKP